MRTASKAVLFSLVSPLLVACETTSDPGALKLQAMSFANSEWSEPVNLGAVVNSNVLDAAPTLSKDGLSLYLTSNRPGGLGGNDLWVSHRDCGDCAWGTPVNLGPVINSPAIENRASLSGDGHLLFFFSDRPGGQGRTDICMSRRADPQDDFGWEPPVNLGADVNTGTAEQAPFYLQSAEDGAGNLYFARGETALNRQDIYVAAGKTGGGKRGPAGVGGGPHNPGLHHPRAALRA